MDRILDAVFDLAIWPIITFVSIFKYSLRKYYHSTPPHLRTLRVFLKTGLGWSAIALLIGAMIFGRKLETGILVGDPTKVIFNYSFAIALLLILTTLPFVAINWLTSGWYRLRHRILKIAVVQDAALIAWSGYFAVCVVAAVAARVSVGLGAFDADYRWDRDVAGALEVLSILVLGILLVNLRVSHVLTRKYARSRPRWYVSVPSNLLSAITSIAVLFYLGKANTFVTAHFPG